MRVISGTARGRRLREPADYNIRPTTDKVKESIFNIIQFEIEGRRVLDLFAGTGQLGLEALSRGAESCVFVDESGAAIKIIGENIKTCGFEKEAQVLRSDALSALSRLGKFDVILLDPPYDTDLLNRALEKIIEFDILKVNGIILCESRAEYVLPEVKLPYSVRKEYKYGKIKLTLYTREDDR